MFIALVGKPSSGKSTFFKAATLAEVEIANYPFTTIKPNSGCGFVSFHCVDKEFEKQCNPREGYCLGGKRFVPVEIIDVAGLVPGAHEGKGMGNQFLDDLRQADVLIHVVDISGSVNEKGEPVSGYDPLKDIEFLEEEIDLWYLGILKKGWEKFVRTVNQEKSDLSKALAKQLSGLKVTEDMVKEVFSKLELDVLDSVNWNEAVLRSIATELRKRTKPMIIAANKIDIKGALENLERAKEKFKDYIIIPCSAECELALKEAAKKDLISYVPGDKSFEIKGEMGDEKKKALEFIKSKILSSYGSTGVQEVLNKAVFDLLGYIAIFPGGVNKLEDSEGRCLPDCFLMPSGTTALDFAYRLHTDFGKNFIRAIDVKTKRTIGKEHELKHRDVIEIVSGK